jgi:hypothetical protein
MIIALRAKSLPPPEHWRKLPKKLTITLTQARVVNFSINQTVFDHCRVRRVAAPLDVFIGAIDVTGF